jgi:hypothetical protein
MKTLLDRFLPVCAAFAVCAMLLLNCNTVNAAAQSKEPVKAPPATPGQPPKAVYDPVPAPAPAPTPAPETVFLAQERVGLLGRIRNRSSGGCSASVTSCSTSVTSCSTSTRVRVVYRPAVTVIASPVEVTVQAGGCGSAAPAGCGSAGRFFRRR